MPIDPLIELKELLNRPLPGGRGFQAARNKRIHELHETVVKSLVGAVKDTYSHNDLAEMYLDEHFGDELARPRVVLSEPFQEMWKDLLLDGDEEEPDLLVNEAADAREHGDTFKPNTELYGRQIHVYDANNEAADNSHIVGTLKQITGMHSYIITVDGGDQSWEVDSVDDLEVPEDSAEPLKLWNAF